MPCLIVSSMQPTISPEQVLEAGVQDTMFLDVRSRHSYDSSRLIDSLHVTLPPLLLRRLKRRGNLMLENVLASDADKNYYRKRIGEVKMVVVVSSDTGQDDDHIGEHLTDKLNKDGHTVHLLKGGFEGLRKKFPHMCDTSRKVHDTLGLDRLLLDPEQTSQRPFDTPLFHKPHVSIECHAPVEVLPHLYLGNASNSADIECLRSLGIRYILNVTPDVNNSFSHIDDFQYLRVPITDHWSQNLSAYFDEAIDFIDEARDRKCGVLVHCLAGISRSVTLTVAYIMHNLRLSMNDAYDYVRRFRSSIAPNFNFMGQLLDFGKVLEARRERVRCCRDCSGRVLVDECTCRGVANDLLLPTCYFSSPASSMSSASASSNASSNSSRFSYEESDGGAGGGGGPTM